MGTATTAVRPDSYYEDESRKAIEEALREAEGREPEEIRFLLHRSYPFGPLRSGRPYKTWRKLLLEKEAEMGFEARMHEKTKEKIRQAPAIQPAPVISSKSDLVRQNPEPKDQESAAAFLRKHCRSAIFMFEDHDELRVTLKASDRKENRIKWEFKSELETGDASEWQAAYIEAAQEAYKVWLDFQAQKF